MSDYFQVFKNKQKDSAWNDFIDKYGLYGIHYFSIPIFNKEKTKAIIISGGEGSSRIGDKSLLIFYFKDGKWEIIKDISLEII